MKIGRYCRYVIDGLSIALSLGMVGFIVPSNIHAAGAAANGGPNQIQPAPGNAVPQNLKNQNNRQVQPETNDVWRNPDNRVMVYIRMKTINHGSLNGLRAAGVIITHVSEQYKVVTGYVSYDRMSRLSHLKPVLNVRLAEKPLLNSKSVKPVPGKGGISGPPPGPFHK